MKKETYKKITSDDKVTSDGPKNDGKRGFDCGVMNPVDVRPNL